MRYIDEINAIPATVRGLTWFASCTRGTGSLVEQGERLKSQWVSRETRSVPPVPGDCAAGTGNAPVPSVVSVGSETGMPCAPNTITCHRRHPVLWLAAGIGLRCGVVVRWTRLVSSVEVELNLGHALTTICGVEDTGHRSPDNLRKCDTMGMDLCVCAVSASYLVSLNV